MLGSCFLLGERESWATGQCHAASRTRPRSNMIASGMRRSQSMRRFVIVAQPGDLSRALRGRVLLSMLIVYTGRVVDAATPDLRPSEI